MHGIVDRDEGGERVGVLFGVAPGGAEIARDYPAEGADVVDLRIRPEDENVGVEPSLDRRVDRLGSPGSAPRRRAGQRHPTVIWRPSAAPGP